MKTSEAHSLAAAPKRARVLVADDHDMVTEMIAMLLGSTPDLIAVICSTLDAAIELDERHGPFDVVILDYNMPGMNGITGLERMKARQPSRPVAIITGTPTPQLIAQVTAAGAAGVIPKTISMKKLVDVIRDLRAGGNFLPEQVETGPPDAEQVFTPREAEILKLLGEGKANHLIAAIFEVEEDAIKAAIGTICAKLGVANRVQAVRAARDRGLV
ncbi:DNA-binding response regulator [Pararhodobacter marinus]|uniref:DNA-binding response regulator n=1 Tax=Pararhodobacter marinus TaxID=2184063 RepID=A0A2U2C602_9RHOB|nr:response regulator transcription factor [Pararhodobacter marinus]PWE27279.1 DNA-binding response regulator [Pararhodobacter marinus]